MKSPKALMGNQISPIMAGRDVIGIVTMDGISCIPHKVLGKTNEEKLAQVLAKGGRKKER